jgi:cell wall-associated NlpC family hydrolase
MKKFRRQPRPGDIILSTPWSWKYLWWILLVLGWTKSLITHAGVAIGGGMMVEAVAGVGVRVAPLPAHYKVRTMPSLTEAERQALVDWALAKVGTPYSWLQFILAGFPGLGRWRDIGLLLSGGFMCMALAAEDYAHIGRWVGESVIAPAECAGFEWLLEL